MDWEKAYAGRAAGMRASEIRELLKLLDWPGILSFAGGIPDPMLFPRAAFAESYAAALSSEAASRSLQYSATEGFGPLRAWIAGRMERLGVPCSEDNILVTSGSQQALDLVGRLFLSPGDTALVTAPTYLGALQAFSANEPRYAVFRPGEEGPYEVAGAARVDGGRVALAYLVPDFANPDGVTLDRAARLDALAVAQRLGIPLIEDAAYEALRYGGEPVPSCLALDVERTGSIDAASTIYCGTFSKTLAPGVRVGWICATREVVKRLVLLKQAADLHTSTVDQVVMHAVAERLFDEQVPRLRAAYAPRRDAMLAALAVHMPEGASWTKPEGGMFVWVTLPGGVDADELLRAALGESVAFVPGRAFFHDGSGRSTLRLNFSLQAGPEIWEGMRRLGGLVERALAAGTEPLLAVA